LAALLLGLMMIVFFQSFIASFFLPSLTAARAISLYALARLKIASLFLLLILRVFFQ